MSSISISLRSHRLAHDGQLGLNGARSVDTVEDVPIEIIVVSDYDGYFEEDVRDAIAAKLDRGESLKHRRFKISAGAYRASAVSWSHEDDGATLCLDFYSIIRYRGFTFADVEVLLKLL